MAGEADEDRDLTEQGRAELEQQCERLRKLGFSCDALWHSPWLRARRTAERLAALVGVTPTVHLGLCSELESPAGRALLSEAALAGRASRLVLVGHQPWLANIAQHLGADEVRDLECAEVVWLVARGDGRWAVHARLSPG